MPRISVSCTDRSSSPGHGPLVPADGPSDSHDRATAVLVVSRHDEAAVGPPDAVTARWKALDRLDGAWRVALVVAPPGSGKTASVIGWARSTPLAVVWRDVSADPQDRQGIWAEVIGRARRFGDDTRRPLRTRHDGGAVDDLLADFAAERRDADPIVLAFDRADEVEDPSFWIDLDTLVERAGDGLRTIVIARSASSIPAGRWRASGALLDIGPNDLPAPPDEPPGAGDEAVQGADRLDVILRGVHAVHRQVAARLAVPDCFDSELAAAVAGPGAGDSVIQLARRGLLERTDDGSDRRRFDPALRRLLLDELLRDDPALYRSVQLETARHLAATGELSAAYRTLTAAGETEAENRLAVHPVLELARAGDQAGVDRVFGALPDPAAVDEPRLVVAVASACLLCGRLALAESWAARLGELGHPDDDRFRRRRHLMVAHLRLLQADLDDAERELAGLGDDPPLSGLERVALVGVGTRVALGRHRVSQARRLLSDAPTDTGHRRLEREALTAWVELLDGDVLTSLGRLEPLVAGLEHRHEVPDQALLDATITAAWAAYLGGDLPAANRLSVIALGDADRLRCDWNLLRAGAVAVWTLLRLSGPAAARSLLIETRLRRRSERSPLDAALDLAEVSILRAQGRVDSARAVLDGMEDGSSTRLMLASLEMDSGSLANGELLAERDSWPVPHRIAATVLASTRDRAGLVRAVEEACHLGLVMPLTGHGSAVDAALAALPLERLHPRLAHHLAAPLTAMPAITRGPVEALTARERTVLALLPSHLTYDQIADRLSLSVNTVKSNIKSIYRKLSVASRSDAVDTARAAGLV